MWIVIADVVDRSLWVDCPKKREIIVGGETILHRTGWCRVYDWFHFDEKYIYICQFRMMGTYLLPTIYMCFFFFNKRSYGFNYTCALFKKKICPQYIFPTFSLLISPSSRKRHKFILERTGHNYMYVGGPKPAKDVVVTYWELLDRLSELFLTNKNVEDDK